MCPAGSFNSQAVSAEDCIRCDCARLTDICSSADLYLAQLPPPAGIFQLVTRNPATLETSSVRRLAPILSGNSQRLYAQTRSFLPDNGVPYFSLPSSHTGNQLKSYGGYFRFSLSFAGEGNLIDEPLIVIQVGHIFCCLIDRAIYWGEGGGGGWFVIFVFVKYYSLILES